MSVSPEGPRLQLPANPAVRTALQAARDESQRYLDAASQEQNAFRAPEVIVEATARAIYTVQLIDSLLREGMVKTFDASGRLHQEGTLHGPAFVNACEKIDRILRSSSDASADATTSA